MLIEFCAFVASTVLVVCVTDYFYNWIYVVRHTWRRDLRALQRYVKMNVRIWYSDQQKLTVPKVFQGIVKKHPEKIAIYFEDQTWTFKDVEVFSNKVANFFKSQGFKKGDSVSLLMENRPEYLGIWLGLAKIGVVTALINTNLMSDPLAHSVNVSKSKGIIFSESFAEVVNNIREKIKDLKFYQFNADGKPRPENGVNQLNENLSDASDSKLEDIIDDGKPRDNLIYIYTSGTTGLPKAAVITNRRCFFMVHGIYYMVNMDPEKDILYDCLPLYHSSGGLIGACQMLLNGVPVVIRRKFSASNFWKDCSKYKCTVVGYVGELCRYLLAAHEGDSKIPDHHVRAVFGNGLRPQIWKQFKEKFVVAEIYELYGSTEGNANLINIDNKPGAVGFIPRFLSFLYPLALVKYDENTMDPVRDSRGFCVSCDFNEPGLLIGKINMRSAINDFTGYADKKESQKKQLRNVFSEGDLFFNSGDILMRDELGYYYFKDRVGDTFRWKGENVATSEVEAVISNLINLFDATVYGVEVPGTEGRAGMAALVDTEGNLDLEKLAKGFRQNLPGYAIPMFLRVGKSVPLTGTFKLKKKDLQKEGYDVTQLDDDVYFYNGKLGKYEKLTTELYRDIIGGKMRL